MDLYSENILDHYQNPRNFKTLEKPDISAEDANPLCGDKIRIDIKIDKKGTITNIGFSGEGCAISQASTSMLTEHILGKPFADIEKLANEDVYTMLGIELSPARVKCALLGLIVLKKAFTLSKYNLQ